MEWFLPDIILIISTPSIYVMLRCLTYTQPYDVETSGVELETNQMSTDNPEILQGIGKF